MTCKEISDRTGLDPKLVAQAAAFVNGRPSNKPKTSVRIALAGKLFVAGLNEFQVGCILSHAHDQITWGFPPKPRVQLEGRREVELPDPLYPWELWLVDRRFFQILNRGLCSHRNSRLLTSCFYDLTTGMAVGAEEVTWNHDGAAERIPDRMFPFDLAVAYSEAYSLNLTELEEKLAPRTHR
ncbi:hypothetical protein [Stratiformator vulcanicus]|uniref:Uncharacterized protein n=1 Tax=Stratiformator vulcanicus TaxID=2527980 RepID=A0A517QWJ6_9PLAN|nr:hypothetical protein [Stratiformator vulcanicus]QDT35953.1 hypothetical protein Pan189_03080 [Stratiformator vulcanicus]